VVGNSSAGVCVREREKVVPVCVRERERRRERESLLGTILHNEGGKSGSSCCRGE
jgi:hypothetical protein